MERISEQRSLIVGTAGHIDHGKTALIKLLTGVETDRLKQEKERGISIELGFASLALPSGARLGVVDVPGHERFIRNMLAGAGGIDLILFVVAADEGVMPQTREHMDIIDLLGVEHGVVALTKIDMVDADFRELVQETVREYLAETCLKGAPIVGVSSTTAEGQDEILAALDEVAQRVQVAERGHLTRLPVDRVFTMEGFGTVVTGTLWAGRLREGETVRVVPRGITTRIKSLEVHNRRVKEALAGQRVAVALHAVERVIVQRGDWLLAGAGPEATTFVDVRVRVLRSAAKPLVSGARMRFHLGAAEVLGRLILLDTNKLAPGKSGWAQLRLEQPLLTERGDRFVLRTYSPMHTVAGGEVVTAGVGRRRRFRDEDLEALARVEQGTPDERVLGALQRHGGRGCDRPTLARETACTGEEVNAAISSLAEAGSVLVVGKRLVVSERAFGKAGETIRGLLEDYQKQQPLSWGLSKSELKKRLESAIDGEVVEFWVRREVEQGRLFARGDRLRHGSDRLELRPEHEALRRRIVATVESAGSTGQRQRELMQALDTGAAAPASAPAALTKETEALLLLLAEAGEIVRVPPDFYFATAQIRQTVARVRDFFKNHEDMRVADFKDLIGVTRKQAVPLLEYLDQNRITLRRGDARMPGPKLAESDGVPGS
jgi:selenocysteine-specific elongation factor